jgi:hypothetical protein
LARSQPGWTSLELATGHFVMAEAPQQVCDLLARI